MACNPLDMNVRLLRHDLWLIPTFKAVNQDSLSSKPATISARPSVNLIKISIKIKRRSNTIRLSITKNAYYMLIRMTKKDRHLSIQ